MIELLVTISIVAVLAAIAAPSFRDFVAGQRIKTASYEISYALTNARSEALKRNANVVMAPNGGGWQNGWNVTAGTLVVDRHEAFSGLTVSGPAASLTYNNSGRLTNAVMPFAISSSAGATAAPRCVSITLTGMPKSKAGAC